MAHLGVDDPLHPTRARTGYCRVCWALVPAILEPQADTTNGVVEAVRVAGPHNRPNRYPGASCPGVGQPVDRAA